jgi:rod shape-determining protein MreC
MQQIFNFVIKNSNRLLFLLLLSISFVMVIQTHSYHRSNVVNSANIVSGGIYGKVTDVKSYFNLREQNQQLVLENAALQKIVLNKKYSASQINNINLKGYNQLGIINAKVTNNSYHVSENYLTINSGSLQGVKTDMAVINAKGVIGSVEKVSENYATVISILNMKSNINAKVKKTNHYGTLTWDAKNAGYVQLTEIPRLASVRKGDTIVTGGRSTTFPENIPIGVIYKIYVDTQTNFFTLNVRLFNDMTNLTNVYILKKKDSEEIKKLEDETINKKIIKKDTIKKKTTIKNILSKPIVKSDSVKT